MVFIVTIAVNPDIDCIFHLFHRCECGSESVSGWGGCGWVFRVFRGFKVGYWVFYGFLGWMYECGATAR